MPVPAVGVDHQKRFQAAVDVIQNLPKHGFYRPSYEVMLRFYSLYKQAVCGPCAGPRPGFWDPVGRYKWDAWSGLGEMSRESAMSAYVDEMKKIAEEFISTTPMNEKTASFLHHFEPLYLVIDDMPQPPVSPFTLADVAVKCSEQADGAAEVKGEDEERGGPPEETSVPEGADPHQSEVVGLTANTVPLDSGVSEGPALTSDSESEIFCDSVDSVEQLGSITIPAVKTNGFHNGHMFLDSCPPQNKQQDGRLEARQVGAGQGGEGAEDGKGRGPNRRSLNAGREGSHHSWRERGVPQGSPRRGAPGGGGGGDGRGGGDGSESGAERLHDVQLQQQIIVALRRLREDMRSVMYRLEMVERLAATHNRGSPWRPCLQCDATAAHQQEDRWWPFDVSGQTIVLFLLWPFVAQGLVHLLRKAQRRRGISS